MRKLLYVLMSIIVGVGVAFAAPCVYGSADFPGSYGCSDEACGAGCSAPYNVQYHSVCKPNDSGCCWCQWYSWDCDCTLGQGHGSDMVTKHSWSNGTCETAPPPGTVSTTCVTVTPPEEGGGN
jgi:hypothetical protein